MCLEHLRTPCGPTSQPLAHSCSGINWTPPLDTLVCAFQLEANVVVTALVNEWRARGKDTHLCEDPADVVVAVTGVEVTQ